MVPVQCTHKKRIQKAVVDLTSVYESIYLGGSVDTKCFECFDCNHVREALFSIAQPQ